ncbi:hypothetical protein EPR50_G00130520 [Perca flavescens]|uniref:Uncharacterized protein n=1 Tax=Perca flavescens TaxID=8167 RepID=A0A484CQB8_PERFV|nr:hypothetical protein EPR50_G00130520 [Perca flavescens]
MVLTNSTQLESILDKYREKDEEWWRARSRGKRAISDGDMHLILDLHNKLRGQVYPPASNMEYMAHYLVNLAKSWRFDTKVKSLSLLTLPVQFCQLKTTE